MRNFVGLDGWFQMRCPLSVNGCQFTQQRFVSDQKERIVYNPVTECFCITSPQTGECCDVKPIMLSSFLVSPNRKKANVTNCDVWFWIFSFYNAVNWRWHIHMQFLSKFLLQLTLSIVSFGRNLQQISQLSHFRWKHLVVSGTVC